jgi:hypothetical protein
MRTERSEYRLFAARPPPGWRSCAFRGRALDLIASGQAAERRPWRLLLAAADPGRTCCPAAGVLLRSLATEALARWLSGAVLLGRTVDGWRAAASWPLYRDRAKANC